MDELLSRGFAPVLRDLTTAGIVRPGFSDAKWASDPEWFVVSLISPGGSIEPVRVERGVSEPVMVAALADAVQEWAIGEIWGTAPTNWPVCPHHPSTHPLHAVTVNDVAV